MKARITILSFFLNIICLSLFAQIPLVYNIENTGANCTPPPFPTIGQLPAIPLLPDPFVFAAPGKGRSISFSDWACRRNEIKQQIENYEIGTKPPKPDTITAVYAPGSGGGTLTVTVTRNAKTLVLYSHVYLPSTGTGPFPCLIGISLANGSGPATGSINSSIITSRPIATIEYVHDQVTQYTAGQQPPAIGPVPNGDTLSAHNADPFFQLYPEYYCPGNIGQYAAWSWGVSRLIDGMEIATKQLVNPLPIDLNHLGITGCSYAGKMALFSGAFDERIALTIAQENGGGGAPSWRYSRQRNLTTPGGVECIDNTDYSWFSKNRMRQYWHDSVYYLPHDHHELMAMCLPRALLETGNTDFTWLSNTSNFVDAMATKQIYNTFGIGDRFGFYIDGGHGHCTQPANQDAAMAAFVDKFLLGIMNVNTDTVMIRPKITDFDTINYARWYSSWGAAQGPLPVQLKGFSAERKGAEALLHWTTATEQNNKGFTVESSTDGTSWQNVGFVSSKASGGNSNAETDYDFREINNLKTTTYYRIAQVDKDNQKKFSDIKLIKGYNLKSNVVIYPNPITNGEVKLVFDDGTFKDVSLTDMTGRIIRQYKKVQHSLAINELKTGSYVVQVIDEESGDKTSHKIVVK